MKFEHHAVRLRDDRVSLCGKPLHRTSCLGHLPSFWDNPKVMLRRIKCEVCEELVTVAVLAEMADG